MVKELRGDQAVEIGQAIGMPVPATPVDNHQTAQDKFAIIMELYTLWKRHPELTLAQLITKACRSECREINGVHIDGWSGFANMDDLQLIRHLVGFYQRTY